MKIQTSRSPFVIMSMNFVSCNSKCLNSGTLLQFFSILAFFMLINAISIEDENKLEQMNWEMICRKPFTLLNQTFGCMVVDESNYTFNLTNEIIKDEIMSFNCLLVITQKIVFLNINIIANIQKLVIYVDTHKNATGVRGNVTYVLEHSNKTNLQVDVRGMKKNRDKQVSVKFLRWHNVNVSFSNIDLFTPHGYTIVNDENGNKFIIDNCWYQSEIHSSLNANIVCSNGSINVSNSMCSRQISVVNKTKEHQNTSLILADCHLIDHIEYGLRQYVLEPTEDAYVGVFNATYFIPISESSFELSSFIKRFTNLSELTKYTFYVFGMFAVILVLVIITLCQSKKVDRYN